MLILYSGKLWPTMVIHALYDILTFSETPLTQDGVGIFGGNIGSLIHVIISLVLWVSFAAFLFNQEQKINKTECPNLDPSPKNRFDNFMKQVIIQANKIAN